VADVVAAPDVPHALAAVTPLDRLTLLIVGLTVKPVGKLDAGNPHVQFGERGRETERCRMAQATAPILDSTKREG